MIKFFLCKNIKKKNSFKIIFEQKIIFGQT